MQQESFFAPLAAPPLAVYTGYGPVGKGASQAHYVLAENGTEYLIKGPSFVPEHPTVGGNEWVAARLASELGLPLLDYRMVTMGGERFFASVFMERGSFSLGIDAQLFGRCANQERAYDVVVFDAWLCNGDRHHENLVVRLPRRTGDPHLLMLNDHSHLLINPGGARSIDGLMSRLDTSPGPYVSLPFVRESIVSADRLGQALAAVESLSDNTIRHAVQTTDGLLATAYRQAYERFLLERRTRLRRIFEEHADVFPNLGR